jgi:N-acetylglucosaminyl-diphospho-decaprenol L-rhamnosyltransferase
MHPRLSVVIVNYNTCALLRACLQSLVAQDYRCEIIVVDNASHDDSVAMVRAEFPQVRLLAQERNTWFCGGNNIGIRASDGEYVLLLNPDTVVSANALLRMVTFLRDNAHYAGVTAQLRYPNGQIQRTCSRLPTYRYLLLQHTFLGWLWRTQKERDYQHHWYAEWGRDSDHDVAIIPGSCTLMRREDVLLDDELWLYFPEDTLAQRVQKPFRFLTNAHIERKICHTNLVCDAHLLP